MRCPRPGCSHRSSKPTSIPIRARVLASQGDGEINFVEQAASGVKFEPYEIDFETVGEFYHKIETGFHNIPQEKLFIGPPEAQANARYVDLGGELVTVADRDSACAAIDMIIEQGEAPSSAHPEAHFVVFETIRREYVEAMARAAESGVPFEPVRPVVSNPMTRFYDDTTGGTVIVELVTHEIADLFNMAYDTMLLMLLRFFAHAEETDDELQRLSRTTLRLMASVIRPLAELLTSLPVDSARRPGVTAGPGFGYNRDVHLLPHKSSAWVFFGERLLELAGAATRLRLDRSLSPEIQEATAALQDLACQFAPSEGTTGVASIVAEWTEMEAGLPAQIAASHNGPYLVTNARSLQSWLGEEIAARPQMAMCRCGGSAIKPFCDGTHARIGFTGSKELERVPDRRDAHVGDKVTVLDNRGTCAHSGFCTDRLASVFRLGKEPFVDANGAAVAEIVRAVRACPSGALSYAIGEVERRDQVDERREATIMVSKDGPYRITGGIPLVDWRGEEERLGGGASKEHYSLCRCGHSHNKPFCSGMHWYVNFHDPRPVPDHRPSLFEWAGGLPALTTMTRIFYDRYVPQDPLLQPLFAAMAPDHPERVAARLGEVFGGPNPFTEKGGGYDRMLDQHLGRSLSEARRARWVSLMWQAADEAALPADAEFRSAFVSYLEWESRLALESSQPGTQPPEQMSVPRWDWCAAGPPASRSSAAPAKDEDHDPVTLPADDEQVTFEKHIKPLFRRDDRGSMGFEIDLWSFDDVAGSAETIFDRLAAGTMPSDGAWSAERVETFHRWMTSGRSR